MSSSREGSPDWLQAYQAPTKKHLSVFTLSSDSEGSPSDNPSKGSVREEEDVCEEDQDVVVKTYRSKKRTQNKVVDVNSEVSLGESPNKSPVREDDVCEEEPAVKFYQSRKRSQINRVDVLSNVSPSESPYKSPVREDDVCEEELAVKLYQSRKKSQIKPVDVISDVSLSESLSKSPVREDDSCKEESSVKFYQSRKRNQSKAIKVIEIEEESPIKQASNIRARRSRVKPENYYHEGDTEEGDDILMDKAPKEKSLKSRAKVENCEQNENDDQNSVIGKDPKTKSSKYQVKAESRMKHSDNGKDSVISKAPKAKSSKPQEIADYFVRNEDDVEIGGESALSKALKTNSPEPQTKVESLEQKEDEIENGGKPVIAAEETLEKKADNKVVSRLPLMMSDKVTRQKALVECDGDSIDMTGDVGVVGRVIVSDTVSGDDEMLLDLKGTIYKTTIIPSRTFCLVSFSQTEAKVEAIMNDFIQLTPQSNVYEAETMVEGTLDGFSFDSDEEADMIPKPNANLTDQPDDAEGAKKGKGKRKSDKPAGVIKKKVKTAAKPAKKGKSKSQATKKTKKGKK